MRRIAQRRPERVRSNAQILADDGEELGEPLDRDADHEGPLDLAHRCGINTGGMRDGGLAEPRREPAFSQFASEVEPELAGAASATIDRSLASSHGEIIHEVTQRPLTWALSSIDDGARPRDMGLGAKFPNGPRVMARGHGAWSSGPATVTRSGIERPRNQRGRYPTGNRRSLRNAMPEPSGRLAVRPRDPTGRPFLVTRPADPRAGPPPAKPADPRAGPPPPAAPRPQQIRGSCSPTSMSTIRSLPTIVRTVTMPG